MKLRPYQFDLVSNPAFAGMTITLKCDIWDIARIRKKKIEKLNFLIERLITNCHPSDPHLSR